MTYERTLGDVNAIRRQSVCFRPEADTFMGRQVKMSLQEPRPLLTSVRRAQVGGHALARR